MVLARWGYQDSAGNSQSRKVIRDKGRLDKVTEEGRNPLLPAERATVRVTEKSLRSKWTPSLNMTQPQNSCAEVRLIQGDRQLYNIQN